MKDLRERCEKLAEQLMGFCNKPVPEQAADMLESFVREELEAFSRRLTKELSVNDGDYYRSNIGWFEIEKVISDHAKALESSDTETLAAHKTQDTDCTNATVLTKGEK